MAFNIANFSYSSLLPYPTTPTTATYEYTYTTADNLSAITTSYFNGASSLVRGGDLINVTAADGHGVWLVTYANPPSRADVSPV